MSNVIKLFREDKEIISKGRAFTRLIGGFSDDNPSITTKQIGELLEYSNGSKTVNLTINRNIDSFDFGTHIVDLKNSVSEGNPVYNVLQSQGYSKQSISNSKNLYILSQSGFLLYLKFAEGDRAVELYKDFIEDYFTLKARVELLEKTLEQELEELIKDRKFITGELIYSESEEERFALSIRRKSSDERIENIKIAIATKDKDKLLEEYQPKVEGYNQFQETGNLLEWNNIAKNLKIGKNTMLKSLREHKILQTDTYEYRGKTYNGEAQNLPYQAYMQYFDVKYTIKNNKRFPKVLVTAKGQEYLYKKLREYGNIAQ